MAKQGEEDRRDWAHSWVWSQSNLRVVSHVDLSNLIKTRKLKPFRTSSNGNVCEHVWIMRLMIRHNLVMVVLAVVLLVVMLALVVVLVLVSSK